MLLALHRLSRPTPWGLGYPPVITDLILATGLRTTSAVNYQLGQLERADLARGPGYMQARAWRVNYQAVMFETEDGVVSAWEYMDKEE